jgi:hypothetical protein
MHALFPAGDCFWGAQGIERPSNVAALDEKFKKAPKAKGEGHERTGLGL